MRQNSTSLFARLAFAAFLMPLALAHTATAAPVVITYEQIPDGFTVINQFAAQGVTFNQVQCRDYSDARFFPAGFAHSGTKGVEQCFAQEFCSLPIEASFTAPQRRVKAWVGYSIPIEVNTTVFLTALDAQGQQVGQATTLFPPQATPRRVNTPLEVIAPARAIARVRLFVRLDGSPDPLVSSLVLDDLEFDTEGPPPGCSATQAPRITITSPSPNFETQGNSFILSGFVTSQTPVLEASVTVTGPSGASYTSDLIGRGFFPQDGPSGE
jgi:hypothetical protein